MKNMLEMVSLVGNNLPQYEWYRGVSGSWHHWEMKVLNGNAVLVVEGSKEMGGYWGYIQLLPEYNPDFESLLSTRYTHDSFDIPEKCAKVLELDWRELTFNDSKLTFSITED